MSDQELVIKYFLCKPMTKTEWKTLAVQLERKNVELEGRLEKAHAILLEEIDKATAEIDQWKIGSESRRRAEGETRIDLLIKLAEILSPKGVSQK